HRLSCVRAGAQLCRSRYCVHRAGCGPRCRGARHACLQGHSLRAAARRRAALEADAACRAMARRTRRQPVRRDLSAACRQGGEGDCLTLNVWRPRVKRSQPLPVMVWLTGGGNHSLSGQGSAGFGGLTYSGERFVPHGVVFVSYNLRLGVLGFLAHPALDAERPEKISGNYGSLDQIAMLRWLNRNIAAFGGDPNKIFLLGTSAGWGNIVALMAAPLTL